MILCHISGTSLSCPAERMGFFSAVVQDLYEIKRAVPPFLGSTQLTGLEKKRKENILTSFLNIF